MQIIYVSDAVWRCDENGFHKKTAALTLMLTTML